jgi:hypothetical protein
MARVTPTSPRDSKAPAHPIAPREPGFCFGGKECQQNTTPITSICTAVAIASYELQGADDSVAVSEARSLLKIPSVARNLVGRSLGRAAQAEAIRISRKGDALGVGF